MDALENLAQTIGVAFELGKAAGSGKVDEQAWRQRHAQINARESAKARGRKPIGSGAARQCCFITRTAASLPRATTGA